MSSVVNEVTEELVDDMVQRSWRRYFRNFKRSVEHKIFPHHLRGTLQNSNTVAEAVDEQYSPTREDPGCCKKCLSFVRSLKLEACFFFYILSYSVQFAANQNMFVTKACYLDPDNYTSDICNNLEDHPKVAQKLGEVGILYSIYFSLIAFLPGAFITVIIAGWCDEFGFKPVLCLAVFGTMIQSICSLLTIVYMNAPLYYSLLCAIPQGLTGSLPCILMSCYSLTAASSIAKKRTIKFFLLQIAFMMALPTGQLISGLTYKSSGFIPIYGTSLGLLAVTFLWVIFFVEQPIPQVSSFNQQVTSAADFFEGSENFSTVTKVRRLFHWKSISGSIRTYIEKRHGNGRLKLMLLVFSVFLLVLNSQTSFMEYFYAKKFDWSFSTYVIVTSAFSLASILIMIPVLVLFAKYFPTGEYQFALFGIVALAGKNILQAVSPSQSYFYLGYSVGMLSNIAPACIRACISKLVSENEYGKVFSILAACESVAPILGNTVLMKLFNVSKGFFPGLSQIISSALLLIPLGILVYCMKKSSSQYGVLDAEEEQATAEDAGNAFRT